MIFCEKKFNKLETFKKHMSTYHKSHSEASTPPSQQINGRSNMENENTFIIMRNNQESIEIVTEEIEMSDPGSL